jgi:hypothetical protein
MMSAEIYTVTYISNSNQGESDESPGKARAKWDCIRFGNEGEWKKVNGTGAIKNPRSADRKVVTPLWPSLKKYAR